MTPTTILHIIYLCIIAGIVIVGSAGMAWWHHDAILEGERKCHASQEKALEEQHNADSKATTDAVEQLQNDKAQLQEALANRPPPVIRKCGGVLRVERPLPAGGTAASPGASQPPDRAVDSGMPQGSGGGDVGEGVRALAEAGQLLAIYRARLLAWAQQTREGN